MNTIETFQKVWDKPYEEAKIWKEETKGKVVGWFPMYAPEELIHAAGALPVYLHGAHEIPTIADKYVPNFYCPPVRLILNSTFKHHFDVVDGFLFMGIDEESWKTAQVLKYHKVSPWVEMHYRPRTLFKPVYQGMVIKETYRIKDCIEDLVKRRITEESLKQSISLYNTNRSLLCQLYDLRRENPGLLHNTEMLAVVGSSMLMPKEKHNQLLRELLSELQGKKGQSKGIKVVLAGSLCDDCHKVTLQTLEEAGLVVVDDELYIGGRYFSTDVSSDGQPFEALASYQWQHSPCPTCDQSGNPADYAPYLIEMVKRSGAQGLVNFQWKFCEYQLFDRPYLRESFAEAGIPYLEVDLSEEAPARGAIKTRFGAFAESIKGGT